MGGFNPVTQKAQNSKAYNRNKSRDWKREIQRNQFWDLLCLRHICRGMEKHINVFCRHSLANKTSFSDMLNATPWRCISLAAIPSAVGVLFFLRVADRHALLIFSCIRTVCLFTFKIAPLTIISVKASEVA